VGALSFELHALDGAARVARLETPHGAMDTPNFFPVATHGAVRGLTPLELRSVGVQGVLSNSYHLHLRPGEALVQRLGGLHGFMAWDGPILTDSGGFQLYSLGHLSDRTEEGVRFRSPIDGSARLLTPESCIQIQEALGADLIAQLDEFEPIDDHEIDEARVRATLERTLRWGRRCLQARRRSDQWLFGIVQGGGSLTLRAESAVQTLASGFDAYAIGGLGVGESSAQRWELLEAALAPLPADVPHYMMGIGTPEDLVQAIGLGVDLFDCVIPTRHGRHGHVFTEDGVLNLRNSRFREDAAAIEAECECAACTQYSRAYLRHGLVSDEVLAQRMLSLHNLAFYMKTLSQAREAIANSDFAQWQRCWLDRYRSA
jgi:queuine tRNA-ribosyltransferase